MPSLNCLLIFCSRSSLSGLLSEYSRTSTFVPLLFGTLQSMTYSKSPMSTLELALSSESSSVRWLSTTLRDFAPTLDSVAAIKSVADPSHLPYAYEE